MGDCGCLLGKGLCSHTPSLSYTGFSTMSSQQEPLKLWGLPLGVPVQTPCVCLHASVGLCDGSSQFLDEPGAVLGRRCPSAPSTQPYLCIPGAHTGTETTTSTSHGTERKGSQHCFQPHGGLDPYRDPQLPAGPFLCILWSHSPAEQRPAAFTSPGVHPTATSSAPREPPSSAWAASPPAWTPALRSVSSLTTS